MFAGAAGDDGDIGKSARDGRLGFVHGHFHGMEVGEGIHDGIGHLAGDGLDEVAGGAFDDAGGDIGKLCVIDGLGQIIVSCGLGKLGPAGDIDDEGLAGALFLIKDAVVAKALSRPVNSMRSAMVNSFPYPSR